MPIQFFGDFLLEQGEITQRQLREANDHMSWLNRKLGELASKAGYMSPEDIGRVQRAQASSDRRFGDIAVELGVLSRQQLDEVVAEQRERHIRLGDSLVELGHLSEERMNDLLAEFEARQGTRIDPFREIPAQLTPYSIVRFALARLPRLTISLADLNSKIGGCSIWDPAHQLPVSAMLCVDEGPGIEVAITCDELFAQTLLDRARGRRGDDAPSPPLADVIGELLSILAGNARSHEDLATSGDGLGVGPPQSGCLPASGIAFEFAGTRGRGYLIFSPLR